MATATTTRRTRKAAQVTYQHVQLKSGRGTVHLAYLLNGEEHAFPACREWRTGNDKRTRYAMTTEPMNCASCNIILSAERTTTRGTANHTPAARASRARRNGKAQDKANAQAKVIIAEETAKVVAKRDEPARKPGCSDEDYELAVRVRELRAAGRAWWAIGHELGLKGSGPSVKTGKTGAAHARRLWEKAWGPTYKDTSVPRDTKAAKVERALTQPGKPFFAADALDLEVLDAVKGKEIEWTTRLGAGNTVVCSIQRAIVSGLHKAEVVLGPKGRVLKFYELPEQGSRISGPLRSVYVNQIEKVGL